MRSSPSCSKSEKHAIGCLTSVVTVALIGKPAALMNKEEKVTAIQFLNDAGAFLITKSGDKVSKYFGISKFTLYSYIDVNSRKSEDKKA